MEQKKNKQPVDWLSVGFLVMAVVCMAVSVPATYSVALLTHTSVFGASLVVFIAEVMSFGAKLATRWFSTWYKQLNSFAVVMLSAAVLPNAVEGWNALWRPDVAKGVWASILTTTIYDFPIFAVLIVVVWAALPPVGVYLSLSFWVRRQHELETEQTPEAVVNRRLQPIIIEMQVQQRLDEALMNLIEQRQKQFSLLTGPVFQAPRLVVSPQQQLSKQPEKLAASLNNNQPISTSSGILTSSETSIELSPSCAKNSELTARSDERTIVGTRLDEILGQVGVTRDSVKTHLEILGIKTPDNAFNVLQHSGMLPPSISFDEFVSLFDVLMEQACDSCGRPLSQGERGVAVKYARRHKQPVRCTECRK